MADGTLVVMGKTPVPGRVKTRMTRVNADGRGLVPLDAEQAADLHEACCRDVLERVYHRAGERAAWVLGDTAHPLWRAAVRDGWTVRSQPTNDLGANLVAATRVARMPVVVIGTDSPDLPTAYIDGAFDALGGVDVVVGPTFDGGYYLIGLAEPCDSVFGGIDWGTDRVFAQTLSRCDEFGLRVAVLPFWYDLDEVADLRRLRVHSGTPFGAAVPYPAAHTKAYLDTLGTD